MFGEHQKQEREENDQIKAKRTGRDKEEEEQWG
jgi:hypothetical protein